MANVVHLTVVTETETLHYAYSVESGNSTSWIIPTIREVVTNTATGAVVRDRQITTDAIGPGNIFSVPGRTMNLDVSSDTAFRVCCNIVNVVEVDSSSGTINPA